MSDLAMFRRVCHQAARQTGGEMLEFRIADGPTPNFHQGIIIYGDRTVAVVCVRDAALLATAVPRVIDFAPARDSGPLTFIDVPDLAAALADTEEFRLLTLTELDGPVDATEWPSISRDDIRYWHPASLGEALFNYWD